MLPVSRDCLSATYTGGSYLLFWLGVLYVGMVWPREGHITGTDGEISRAKIS